MIAFPKSGVPVPDAVAFRVGLQLPARVKRAVDEAALCGRLLTSRCLAAADDRTEPTVRLHARLAAANRILAAYDPRLVTRWADMPSPNR